ncbi:MAG TPA: response regulator transcription factor [Gaiellales bacterium]|nr:response regulator transcription factor [Gaiellales bacterium]
MAEPQIVVVDDHPLCRRALVTLFEAEGFRVAATGGAADQVLAEVVRLRPQLMLVDTGQAGEEGLDLIRRVVERLGDSVRVVVLTESADPQDMLAALRAGAVGYLTKDQEPARLAAAVRGALRGEAAVSRLMAAHLIEDVRRNRQRVMLATRLPHRERLTPRQLEILELIAGGATTAEIAGRLFLSPETVRWHVKSILRKLNARTRAEAAAALREVAV